MVEILSRDKNKMAKLSKNDFHETVRDVFLARAVQKVDNAIYRINHYPVDSVLCFVNTSPLDSDLSGG